MMKKTMALALCSLFAVGAVLPVAQAGHFTFYVAPFNMHKEISAFELDYTDPMNKNGPADDDTRDVPDDNNIYPTFRGKGDILTKTLASDPGPTGATGKAIMDHFLYGSGVEIGWIVPYQYAVGQAAGQSRTTPTSIHFVWFGWYEEKDAVNDEMRGVINDVWCTESAMNCGGDDEFAWRGDNSGETGPVNGWNGLAFVFPGDYDGSNGCCSRVGGPVPPSTGLGGEILSGLSGDCDLYNEDSSNPGCVTPSPDFAYADSTASAANSLNQRWAGNNGGGQYTPEEFLLVSQHIISYMVKGSLLDPASKETLKVGCTASEACYRDYDWYQAASGDLVGGLYLTAMRTEVATGDDTPSAGVRSVWYWGEKMEGGVRVPQVSPCPVSVLPYNCSPDTRHTDAVKPIGATNAAFATQAFSSVAPAYTGTPALVHPAGASPPQGFYGDYSAVTGLFTPESTATLGGFVRPTMGSWLWNDANGDGYIGRPDPEQILLWELGAASSPNDGACDVAGGGRCELTPTTAGYKGKVVKVTPSSPWPPGTQWFKHYENGYHSLWCPTAESTTNNAVICHEEPAWHMGAVAGSDPVVLRADPERCAAKYFTCRTIDAILVPEGSPHLTGLVLASAADTDPNGEVKVTWLENAGANTYTVTFDAMFESPAYDPEDLDAADYSGGATAIAGNVVAYVEDQV